MPDEPVTSGASSGSGSYPKSRACSNCARLKMKCAWPTSDRDFSKGKVCSRCARMKLTCQVPTLTARKKRGKSTRVAQLESKIDGIVSLLEASQHAQTQTPASSTADSQESVVYPGAYPYGGSVHSKEVNTSLFVTKDGMQPTPASQSVPASYELLPGFQLSTEEAERYFTLYQQEYLPCFPFVIFEKGETAAALCVRSEILFWAVMAAVVPQSTEVQHETKKWIKQHITNRVVVQQHRHLSYLQATLLYLTWMEFHFYIDSPATNVLQLAQAMVINLRLERDPDMGLTSRTLMGDAWAMCKPTILKERVTHTPDEMRALLGFYHIAALETIFFKRGPFPLWTKYHTHCVETLATADGGGTDALVVALVKVQRVTDRLTRVQAEFEATEGAPVLAMQYTMAIESAVHELQTVACSLSECVKQNFFFWTFYHALSIRIYEPLLSLHSSSSSSSLSSASPKYSTLLYQNLQSTTAYFEAKLSTPPASIDHLVSASLCTVAFVIISTSRLVLLEPAPDWDPVLVRKTLDFATLIRRMSELHGEADRAAKETGRKRRVLDDGASAVGKYAVKLRWISQWYVSRASEENVVTEGVTANFGEQWNGACFDEDFWRDLVFTHDVNFEMPQMSGP